MHPESYHARGRPSSPKARATTLPASPFRKQWYWGFSGPSPARPTCCIPFGGRVGHVPSATGPLPLPLVSPCRPAPWHPVAGRASFRPCSVEAQLSRPGFGGRRWGVRVGGVYTNQTEGRRCFCWQNLFIGSIIRGTSAVRPPGDISVCFKVLVGPLSERRVAPSEQGLPPADLCVPTRLWLNTGSFWHKRESPGILAEWNPESPTFLFTRHL